MSDQEYIVCKCNNCDQRLEFPLDGLGTDVRCPGRGFLTKLYRPVVPIERTPVIESENPQTSGAPSGHASNATHGNSSPGDDPTAKGRIPAPEIMIVTAVITLAISFPIFFLIQKQREASQRAKLAAIEAAKPRVVRGQIYLALEGGDSIRFPAVNVMVVRSADVQNEIPIQTEIAESNLDYWLGRQKKVGFGNNKIENEIRFWKSSSGCVPEAWPIIVRKTTTDADGRFSVDIPLKGSFCLVANVVRFPDGPLGYGFYYGWMVPIPQDRNKIYLNNNNLAPHL